VNPGTKKVMKETVKFVGKILLTARL